MWISKLSKQCSQILGSRRSLLPQPLQMVTNSVQRMSASTSAWKRAADAAAVAHRPYPCCLQFMPDEHHCFDKKNITLEMGNQCTEKLIRAFIYSHYWPREPTTNSAYLSLDSELLEILTEKYCTSGDRYIAFEKDPRTKERNIVGLLVANKIMPWTADELNDWANGRFWKNEYARLDFMSRCIREPNLIEKYKVPYLYDFEILVTDPQVAGHGVSELLMAYAMARAMEMQEPMIHMICKSKYMKNACERLGMKEEWTVKYNDINDHLGNHLFYHRYPHYEATVYSRRIKGVEGGIPDKCKDPFIYEVYMDRIKRPITDFKDTRTCFRRPNMYYSVTGKPPGVRPCVCTCYKNIFSKGHPCPCKCYRYPMTKMRAKPPH